jgi:predicted nucleic acid-binding protein
VNTRVIVTSIAIKWVVEKDGSELALALRQQARLVAPDPLVPECANILWNKVPTREAAPHGRGAFRSLTASERRD